MSGLKLFVKQGLKVLKGWRITYSYRKKIKQIIKRNSNLREAESSGYLNDINNYWKEQMNYKIKTDWHFAYSSVNGIKDPRYIPEDLFYKEIVPRLNRLDLAQAYSDKNSHKYILKNFSEPRTVLRNINSIYYDDNFNQLNSYEVEEQLKQLHGKFIIKPSIESGGGKSVHIARIKNAEI